MAKKQKRRSFSEEFKLEAARLVREGKRSIASVARELDVYESSLGRWVKQYDIDHGKGPEGALSTEERQELQRLRRENRQLREDREILGKAAAFFAKENR